jgi:intein/homing endonuclease
VIKVAFFQGEDEHGPRVIPLFGPADPVFEKVAAPTLLPEVSKYIAGLKPRNDSQYVLLNAMGASEWWGSNINGDAFTEASLIHKPEGWTGNPNVDREKARDWAYGFPTFYFAHPYAHHRNKDAKRAFGDVELAAWHPRMKRVELVARVDKDKCDQFGGTGVWDKLRAGDLPDVSMGAKVPFDTCFPAGTLVRTEEGQRPIEEIQVGDFVLSHTGTYREVRQTMRRRAEGLVRITASGLPRIDATDNHPFLVLRREQARTCKGSANGSRLRHTFSNSATCRRCGKTPEFELVWAAAETLKPGDYLATPVVKESHAEYAVTPAQARLLGYYLGDGYIIQQRTGKKKDGDYRDMGFGFSVGSAETEHLRRLLCTIVAAGAANDPNVYDAGSDRKAYIVSVYDQSAAAQLQKWGGRTSHGKRLIEEVFHWSHEAKLELVAGYIDTDGSFDESGQVRIASVNRGLLLDIQRLLLSEGITATVCFAGTSSGFSAGSLCWYLALSSAQSQKFLGRSTKVRATEVGWESPQSFFWGGYWLTPVKAVEELDGDAEVFNLSVDKDESYVAEGRAVHNCSICLDWETYRRAQGMFNPERHRSQGDAVLAYHKELIKKRGEGKGIRGVSITRKDYCEHAGRQMNHILPDGRKVFVYNDYPKFFDISFVFIGADKTAKVMMKIADAGKSYWFRSGAELAEKLGYGQDDDLLLPAFAPDGTASQKVASVTDETLKQAFLGKLAKNKDAEITKDVVPSQFAGKAVPLLTRNEKDLPKSMIDALGASTLEEALSTPTGLGMVLRPREFQRIILIQMGKRDLADELDHKGEVFSKSNETLDVPMGPSFFSQILARLLLPMMSERSGLGPVIEKRVLVATGDPKEKRGGSSSLSNPVLRKMGSAYNGYRTAVMNLVTHAPELLASMVTPSTAQLNKLATASVESVFTPLSAHYLKLAFWDEVTPAIVERGSPSRNTSAISKRAVGGY